MSKEQPVETAPAPTQTEKGFFILLYLTWRILFHTVQTKRNTEFQFWQPVKILQMRKKNEASQVYQGLWNTEITQSIVAILGNHGYIPSKVVLYQYRFVRKYDCI